MVLLCQRVLETSLLHFLIIFTHFCGKGFGSLVRESGDPEPRDPGLFDAFADPMLQTQVVGQISHCNLCLQTFKISPNWIIDGTVWGPLLLGDQLGYL